MWRRFARRVHEIKPDFVFSGYDIYDWPLSRGLSSPEVPFIVVYSRHYCEGPSRAWWRTQYAHNRKLGFMRIAGSYDWSFFGGQPASHVGPAQWMYDAAINSDGYWIWFEQELTDDTWRAFGIADRLIRTVERKVGRFLLNCEQDVAFATVVEWTGAPELQRKIIQKSYHLGDEHLIQINNVDPDRPVQLRLRLGKLAPGSRWIVRDPIGELVYVHDGGEAVWDASQLANGVIVLLQKRSDLFVELSPASEDFSFDPAAAINTHNIKTMPEHGE